MNLKQKLCEFLLNNNLVKENDVIKHSYSNSRLYEWNKRNVEFNNMSPTLDTRCDCLGVVVRDGDDDMIINPLKGKSPYGWHFEQEVYLPIGIARALKAGGGSGNIPKVILESYVYFTLEDGNENCIERYEDEELAINECINNPKAKEVFKFVNDIMDVDILSLPETNILSISLWLNLSLLLLLGLRSLYFIIFTYCE